MDDAQVVPVKQHFKDGQLKRLDLTMLPRDKERSMGGLRKQLINSFNYCRQYPRKLAVFIVVMKYVTNYASYYKAGDDDRREKNLLEAEQRKAEAARIMEAQVEVLKNNVQDLEIARIEEGVAYNAAGESLGLVEVILDGK